MSHWEAVGKSDDWYTPKYIFDALACRFDMDVAAPPLGIGTHVPADHFIYEKSLDAVWLGFIWMNPPFGGRNAIEPWLEKFFDHGNGIAVAPDRTSAPWFQQHARRASSILFLPKVRFMRPDGSLGASPSNGTVLFGIGAKADAAMLCGSSLGLPMAIARAA